MTPRERLLTAMRCEESDKVPVCPRSASIVPYGCACWMHTLKAAREFDFDPIILFSPSVPVYTWYPFNQIRVNGVEVQLEEKRFPGYAVVSRRIQTPEGILTDKTKMALQPHETGYYTPTVTKLEYLIKGPEDLAKIKYLLPNLANPLPPDYHEVAKHVGEEGLVEVVVKGPLTDDFVVDVYELMKAYFRDRRYVVDLLRLLQDHTMAVTKACLEAGAEAIWADWYWCGLSVGWSPKMYKELFAPLIREQVDLVHGYGAVHHLNNCGNRVMDTIHTLRECGIDVLEALAPPPWGDVDLSKLKKEIGDKVCLYGYIDNTYLLKNGNPEAVDKAVKEAISIAAPGGGFILGTMGGIRHGVPIENMKAYYKAGRKYGKYA